MGEKTLFCEACGRTTNHVVEGDDETGELALCRQCGRLSSQPPEQAARDPADNHRPPPPRPRPR